MANRVLFKKSSVAARVPLSTDLEYGEIAINYADEKIYIKNSSDVIKSFNADASVTSVAALSFGITGTDVSSTVATGTTTPVITLNIPTASAENRGALSSADWSTFNNKQPAGSYLTSAVTTFSAGTTGLTPSTATSGAVTLAGTLAIDNGGTGLTTLTANGILVGNGTGTLISVAPGTTGQVLTTVTTGAAPTWATPTGGVPTAFLRTATLVAPTAGTTVFTIAYTAGYIDVFLNGIKLVIVDDFTATNGTSVTLNNATLTGDSVEFVIYPLNSNTVYTKTEVDAITGNISAALTAIIG